MGAQLADEVFSNSRSVADKIRDLRYIGQDWEAQHFLTLIQNFVLKNRDCLSTSECETYMLLIDLAEHGPSMDDRLISDRISKISATLTSVNSHLLVALIRGKIRLSRRTASGSFRL